MALNTPSGLGDRAAQSSTLERADPAWRDSVTDLLAETSERVIEEFDRTGGELGACFLAAELRAQTAARRRRAALLRLGDHRRGCARTPRRGRRVAADGRGSAGRARLAGTIFKIIRRTSGEKLVYVRLFAGALAVRQRVVLRRNTPFGELEQIEERITGIERFAAGATAAADSVGAGDIAALHGLRAARIGDRIGCDAGAARAGRGFPPPALESVVRPLEPGQITHLRAALEQLAEQDPLISLRQRNEEGEISDPAVWRGAERSHAGDAGAGVRPRRDVRPEPDDLHRAAGWRR